MSQESFSFGFLEQLVEDDFIVSSSNFSAFSLIDKWPKWDSNILLIYGSKSSGKTHLARIWQNRTAAELIQPNVIYDGNYVLSKNYILEDIELMHDEAALLHFFNSMKEKRHGYLLMTASNHPLNLGIRLPDLRSRLNSIPSAGVADPDDELLRTVFLKQFTDRQLKVDMEVINYLITRIERSFESLCNIVDVLDKCALKEKKNITIPFARKILEKLYS